MNITSKDTMLFVKKDEKGKTHYRAGLSSKNIKGEYESAYIDVKMPKDTNLPDKTKIDINKGFLGFYNYKDKEGKTKTIWYIVVQEYSVNVKIEQEVMQVESIDADKLELPF